MQAAKFQRLYILLRPCAQGGGGYARLEQARGKYTLTVNAHGFAPSEEGLRILLAAKDDGGSSAICDLGLLPVSQKGQSSHRREVSATPGGLPLDAYSALCIAKDWPSPKLLLMGALEERDSLSSYLIGETVCRYLSVPAKTPDATPEVSSPQEAKPETITAPGSSIPSAQVNTHPAIIAESEAITQPAATHPLPLPSAMPTPPQTVNQPDIPAVPMINDPLPFPLVQASPTVRSAYMQSAIQSTAYSLSDEPAAKPHAPESDVFTCAAERLIFPPDIPTAGPPPGRPIVTALPKLQWPTGVKELERYFSTYPPFAPFDAPGWRFVQIPMAAGSTIPYYAVGMLAREGKVVQVAYAVPGDRSGLPPAGFSGYRWQQGRNGQGYWTLWKRAQ